MAESFNLLRKTYLRLLDFSQRLVTGNLTSDGIQYSTEVTTTTINTDVDILNITIDPGWNSNILWIEFGLTAALRAVTSITADLIWKWQARNKNGIWTDLHVAVVETDIGITYVERSMSGYFEIVTNFNKIPMDVRLILQCNELNEGRAKVKNNSYVRIITKI